MLILIQARMGSTRLPGKAMLPMCGKPMLQHVIKAALGMVNAHTCVVTPPGEANDPIEHLCNTLHVECSRRRHPTRDVLGEFYHAWTQHATHSWILRLTADCPMLTTAHLQRFVARCGVLHRYTLYTNRLLDADGLDMELFSADMLCAAYDNALVLEREHVCPWMYRHGNVIRVSACEPEALPLSADTCKVSVDTQAEYDRVCDLMTRRDV